MIILVDHITDNEASFRLMRILEWAGITPAPSRIRLEGSPYASSIPASDLEMWATLIQNGGVLVTMGEIAAQWAGVRGHLVNQTRGYIYPCPHSALARVIPTVHPGFIQRGNAKWSAAFINDLQKAALLDQQGMPPQLLSYSLDPSPAEAYAWAQRYRVALQENPDVHLAFDIETPYKGDAEDESDATQDAPDASWVIERIGFAYDPLAALSIPWAPEYFGAIRLLCESAGPKVVWNAGYDVPRLRRAGFPMQGLIHDGMVAWHILHSDLPKRLAFVATFTCPWQPAWKHLSGARPAFYNASDADVELRSYLAIRDELHHSDLWSVYQSDVLDLEPILTHMSLMGMRVDPLIRLDRARKLQDALSDVKATLELLIPLEARRIAHVYQKTPKDTSGCLSRPSTRQVRVCNRCGSERPGKPHFKEFKRKLNPCAGGGVETRSTGVDEYYRLAEWSPSPIQLAEYHRVMRRACPTVWDKVKRKKRISFGERQILDLVGKYPLDAVYPNVLQYRSLMKIAGTYVGVIEE